MAIDLATARDLHATAYAGSAACGACHAEHSASWHRTFHRTMTQEATPATVARQAARLWPDGFAGAAAPAGDHGAPKDALFAGDPIARALAANAFGPRAGVRGHAQPGAEAGGAVAAAVSRR